MKEATELLVRMSAAQAARPRRPAEFEEALDAVARGVETGELARSAVEEALLQSYLFLGYPAALTALDRWRARGFEPAVEEDDPLAEPDRTEAWAERGEDVCSRVYGSAYAGLRENVRRLHPAMDRWMVTEGYGKVLGRPGLALAARELCAVAVLGAEGWVRQLHSHLRVGAPPADVELALEAGIEAAPDAGGGRGEELRSLWTRVRERVPGGDGARSDG